MAIRLASAIGSQREPISILGNVAEGLNKTGDAIAEGIKAQNAEKAKKADQEQKLKDAIAASTDYDPINAHPEDNEKYRKDGEEGVFNIIKMSHTAGVTSAQMAEAQRKLKLDLAEKKIKYEGDWNKIKEAAVAQGNTHETQHFADFVQRGTPDTEEEQVVPVDPSNSAIKKVEIERQRNADLEGVENEDAINEINAKYDKDAAELEKIATKTVTKKGQPSLLSLPWDERKKIDINAKYDELAIPIIPNTINVAKSIPSFGKDFEYKDFVTTTTTSKGELKYGIDVEGIKKGANFYADEVVTKKLTPYSKDFMQYQNALTKMATNRVAQDVKEADFPNSGELVKDNVRKAAYQAFYDDAMREAEAQTKRLREAREKTSGRGVINNGSGMFSNGNTSMNKTEEITPYIQRKYAAKETQIKTNIEKLKNSTNPTDQQTVKGYEKSLSDLERLKASEAKDHVKYSNAKSKDDQYVTYVMVSGKDKEGKDIKENISFRPEDFFERNGQWYMAGEEKKEELDDDGKNVVTYLDRELPLDENNYKKLITEDRLVIPLLEKHGIKASGVNQSAAPSKGAAPKKEVPTIKSEAEFNKLPKGAKFYNSKGVLKTKG